jgi:hypothetical protein
VEHRTHRGREPAARVCASGIPSCEELEEEHAEVVHVALLGGHAGAEEVQVDLPPAMLKLLGRNTYPARRAPQPAAAPRC